MRRWFSSYRQRGNLVTHMRKRHPDVPPPATAYLKGVSSLCKVVFAYTSERGPYRCEIPGCALAYTLPENLQKHIAKKHPGVISYNCEDASGFDD